MVPINVTVALVYVEGGKKDVVLTISPAHTGLSVVCQLASSSARDIAAMLIDIADKAESRVILPPFDSVKPPSA